MRVEGGCSGPIDLFLARDLSPVALADRIEREAEEAHMSQWWVPLDKAVESVLAGKITDAKTISAILAVAAR